VTQTAACRSRYLVALVLLIFFVMSLLTNIIGPIIPEFIRSFRLSLTAAALLPFSFFIAYGVMSIPAGLLIERQGEKRVLLAAFSAAFAGALAFALVPAYGAGISSFFVIGAAMAMLQVAINPLLRVAGGEENFAFNSAFAQLVFGSASFLSPRLYSTVAKGADRGWVSLYWIFAGVSLLMMLVLWATRFPRFELADTERVGAWATHRKLFRRPVVLLYFASVFAYVGTEQGTADWISQFLATYHHYDPQTAGANAVSWFWGLLTAGCLLGMLLLKLFDSRKVLIGFSAAAIGCLSAALFGSGPVASIAFPLMGFFASVMWPIIVSLALNSLAEHHGTFAGILCTAIAGGAVVPLVIGRIGDAFGLRAGMAFLYLDLAWILAIGFWARPIVTNKTIAGSPDRGLKPAAAR
jgi:FHS family L-fucose permease-like MFS transporter